MRNIMNIINKLSEELGLPISRLEKTIELIDDGNTIPFIARYRKEVTGSMDDVTLRELFDRLTYLRNLEARKAEVAASITEQGKMTDEIASALEGAQILAEVEDIYRPFKQKRRTRASIAKERGLEPLAVLLLEQREHYEPSIETLAEGFVDPEKGVEDETAALAGARDIIAETVSDNADYRRDLREMFFDFGVISSKAAKDEDSVYSMYYDYSEGIKSIADHRILALNRGEKEGFLKVDAVLSEEVALNYLMYNVITATDSPAAKYVREAVIDGYQRLIKPSVENEVRSMLFDKASEGAIKLFSDNLKHLLMQPPIKGRTVLGLDPGYRTGCKLAVVDKTGKVLDTAVIYPTKPQERIEESARIVKRLIGTYGVELIAIGNGTASKESEIFVAGVLKELDSDVRYAMVSEAGASVYSASKLASEEFPDFDVTQRSAVSIARRLQDPLAELVKIDPKSIGVGQYQHDMKSARLDESLAGVVEDCVNSVGVDINTASHSLLEHISGINAASAKNIVKYREENGEFKNRRELKKVPRIGDKAFEQCAGFLRVPESKEIFDNTGVHPESYSAAKSLLEMFGYTERDVRESGLSALRAKVESQGLTVVAEKLGIGVPTLEDIIGELEKPGRDVRDSLPAPILRDDVMDIADLKPGMKFTGTVRNVIDFGAFVDIGVHQDGLVHISEISDHYIKHPSQVLSVGDIVNVTVKSVDPIKKRIALTMKNK